MEWWSDGVMEKCEKKILQPKNTESGAMQSVFKDRTDDKIKEDPHPDLILITPVLQHSATPSCHGIGMIL